MKTFLYMDYQEGNLIKVYAKKKPSKETMPYCGTWRLDEWDCKSKTWAMPCFAEVTLPRLNKMIYIGELK